MFAVRRLFHLKAATGAERLWTSWPPTDVLTGVSAITASYNHTCALTDTGGVRCWGHNPEGQLGDGTTTDIATPASDVLTGAQAISAGNGRT